MNQTLESQQTPHISPSRVSYGVSLVRILETIDHIIMAPLSILMLQFSLCSYTTFPIFLTSKTDKDFMSSWRCLWAPNLGLYSAFTIALEYHISTAMLYPILWHYLNSLSPGRFKKIFKNVIMDDILPAYLVHFLWNCTGKNANNHKSTLVQEMAWCIE